MANTLTIVILFVLVPSGRVINVYTELHVTKIMWLTFNIEALYIVYNICATNKLETVVQVAFSKSMQFADAFILQAVDLADQRNFNFVAGVVPELQKLTQEVNMHYLWRCHDPWFQQ